MKNILVVEEAKSKFAFRIPNSPIRYRGNCKYGYFVQGDLGTMEIIEAQEKKLLYGKSVSMAIASISTKVLTFEPHYHNECFLEVWGFPVDGEMHNRPCKPNSSELITFLLHRRSMDKFMEILAEIERDADNEWIDAGMPDNMEEFISAKKTELLVGSIFTFEFAAEDGKYGKYYWIKSSRKNAESDLAKASLKCSKQLFELKEAGERVCVDPRIEELAEAVAALAGNSSSGNAQLNPASMNSSK